MTKTKKIILYAVVVAVIVGAVVAAVCLQPKEEFKKIESLEDLTGQRIAVMTGAIFDTVAEKNVKDVQLYYSDNETNSAVMLEKGKVKGWVTDEPIVRYAMSKYPNLRILAHLTNDTYAYIFNMKSERSQELCKQMNQFLAKIKEDGTLAEIDAVWFGADEDVQVVDFPSEGENGKVVFATCSSVGAPFTYIKNGEYAGYDIDIVARFCKEYGYTLEIQNFDFAGLLTAVQTGKGVDFGGACITVTEERAKKILFSDANYEGGVVMAVSDEDTSEQVQTLEDVFNERVESFNSTFIKENRWMLFAEGIGNTMLITVLSVLFGTVLGFVLFWLTRNTGKIGNGVISLFTKLVEGMPVVVLLMVLYYVVFGQSKLSNITVSIIGFSFVFGAGVLNMLIRSTDTVSYAQTEASLALGFTKTQTFMKVIMPQALRHFLPAFKSEVVSLLKATAIVGYLAVQDLTKMSDIVRGRTYEAFYPLIATAVIYFILEGILIGIVKAIQINTDPKRRTAEKILKGVETK